MILLVTGSRVLAEPTPRQWATVRIMHAICGLSAEGEVVVGDAVGPDELAWQFARTHGNHARRFRLDGLMEATAETGGLYTEPWTSRTPTYDRRWPLVRNAAMVAWCAAEMARTNGEGRCLALVAPWATTRGTDHTASLARKAGLMVERLECPQEYR